MAIKKNRGTRYASILLLLSATTTNSGPVPVLRSNCPEKDRMPIGVANQGGYVFNYQSARGDECRVYRIQNTQGKLLTPALWKDSSEVFLDVNLPECKKGAECPWTEAIKISSFEVRKGDTVLSYGVNKDEYRDTPGAFRKTDKEMRHEAFITRLRGVVMDAEHKTHKIDVEVESSAKRLDGGDYLLSYSFKIDDGSDPVSFLPNENARFPGLQLYWPLPSRMFYKPPSEQRFEIQKENPKEELKEIVFTLQSHSILVDWSNVLSVSKEGQLVAATTAPAYVPAR